MPSSPPTAGARNVKVNWRGIVDTEDDPLEEKLKEPPKEKKGLFELIRMGLYALLSTLGIMRKKNPDGTYRPRPWKNMLIVYGGAAAVALVISMGHIVPAGSVSVPLTFGSAGTEYKPGFHITLPWPLVTMQDMTVQTQNYTMTASTADGQNKSIDDSVSVLGRDGAGANVDATVLYKVDQDHATQLYERVGTDYASKIIRPGARTCIRTKFTNYDLVAAATDSWQKVSDEITQCMKDKIEGDGLLLQDFQLREVSLSQQVQASIDAKVASQQDAERQKFEIQTAEQQADIQRVKAQAAADSQQILACGGTVKMVAQDGQQVQKVVPNPVNECSQAQLTPQFLQYTYIQALKDLVNSPQNSTVILPFDQNLTPLLNLPSGQKQATVNTPGQTTNAPTPSTP